MGSTWAIWFVVLTESPFTPRTVTITIAMKVLFLKVTNYIVGITVRAIFCMSNKTLYIIKTHGKL